MDVMRVDCGTCRAQGPACADCAISVLLGPMPDEVLLDGPERAALAALAGSGMLPPLRLKVTERTESPIGVVFPLTGP